MILNFLLIFEYSILRFFIFPDNLKSFFTESNSTKTPFNDSDHPVAMYEVIRPTKWYQSLGSGSGKSSELNLEWTIELIIKL